RSNVGKSSNVVFKNNIIEFEDFIGTLTKYGIFLDDSSDIISDFNNIYLNPNDSKANTGFKTRRFKTPNDWQGADSSNFDQNSFFVKVQLNHQFKAGTHQLDQTAEYLNIDEDFYGVSRDSFPDIGAVENNCSKPYNLNVLHNGYTLIIDWTSKNPFIGKEIRSKRVDTTVANYSFKNSMNGATKESLAGLVGGEYYRLSVRLFCTATDTSIWSDEVIYYLPACGDSLDINFSTKRISPQIATVQWNSQKGVYVNRLLYFRKNNPFFSRSILDIKDSLTAVVSEDTLTNLSVGPYEMLVEVGCPFDTSDWRYIGEFDFSGRKLCGDYTIDQNGSISFTNYTSFQNLTHELKTTGISCPVFINVVPGSGPYTEQVLFEKVLGTNDTHRIIINGHNETIQFNPTTQDYRVVGFDSASYITLDNFKIKGNNSQRGIGVHFKNQSNHNAIQNCTIDMSALRNTSFGRSAGIAASNSNSHTSIGGDNASDLTVLNNAIVGDTLGGPFAGIALNGDARNNVNNRIIGNLIRDFYSDGIYFQNQSDLIIEGNRIERPRHSSVGVGYGVFLEGSNSSNLSIRNNQISNFFGGRNNANGKFYGIYLLNNTAPNNSIIDIYNNLINGNGTDGDAIGLYNQKSNLVNYDHNTFVVNNPSSNLGKVQGVYIDRGSDSRIYNNLIYINKGGTASKHGIYNLVSANLSTDYNNVYFGGTTSNAHYGHYLSNRTSLVDWRASVNGYGTNSDTINPQLIGSSYRPSNALLNNRGKWVGIATDFEGFYRDSVPDIGALEFDTITNYLPVRIQDIHSEAINGVGDSTGGHYEIEGTAMSNDLDSSNSHSFFLTNRSSSSQNGIHLRHQLGIDYSIKKGDSIAVRGVLEQVNGLLSMNATFIKLLDTVSAAVMADTVFSLNENTESKKVYLSGISVVRGILPNGDVLLRRSADSIYLAVKSVTDVDDSLAVHPFKVGDSICKLSGIASQQDSSFPYTSHYQIIPLQYTDIDLLQCQTVGVNETTIETPTFIVFPNPSNGNFNISFRHPIDRFYLELFNSKGQLVWSYSRKAETQITIDCAQSSGIYILRIIYNNGSVVSKKLIKQ
ncbi:MAG: hypothetical protein CMO34_01685, partial [Verrucomicrobia bacterium]|nr:hypothetical protein [Verrucomicrobiota bacterium]